MVDSWQVATEVAPTLKEVRLTPEVAGNSVGKATVM